jgi:nucleoside-diphosphate-sugar epimerase
MTDTTKYLVTGANGWLGRRMVKALREGHAEMGETGVGSRPVRALVMPGEPTKALLDQGVEVVTGDVRDAAALAAFTAGADGAILIHLAGIIHPTEGVKQFDEVNLNGTRRLVDAAAAAGLARVVVMSSNSPIGANPRPDHLFDENSPYHPYMGYGRSKQKMEEMLKARMASPGGPEIVILRAPWFYGPDQPPRQSRFFSMIKAGRFPLMGRGLNRRSMGYVDSLAFGALLAAASSKAAGRIYWLADERPYPMAELIDTVRAVLRDDFGMTVAPKTVVAPPIVADVARLIDASLQSVGLYNQEFHVLSEMNLTIACSIERAKAELGYRPLVELHEGMRRSVQWCLDNGISI